MADTREEAVGAAVTVWTLGHSNQVLADFLALLDGHGIRAIADVRRFPSSRKFPHFGADALAQHGVA